MSDGIKRNQSLLAENCELRKYNKIVCSKLDSLSEDVHDLSKKLDKLLSRKTNNIINNTYMPSNNNNIGEDDVVKEYDSPAMFIPSGQTAGLKANISDINTKKSDRNIDDKVNKLSQI